MKTYPTPRTDALLTGFENSALPSKRMLIDHARQLERELLAQSETGFAEYEGLLGTLAALDVVLVSHDQPVIAREIVQAAGPKQVMAAAVRSEYPFLKQLRKLYRDEGLSQ